MTSNHRGFRSFPQRLCYSLFCCSCPAVRKIRSPIICRANLGTVYVAAEFTAQISLRNTSRNVVQLTNVTSSCGCTRVESFPSELEPGQQADIALVVNPGSRGYGRQASNVHIVIQDGDLQRALEPILVVFDYVQSFTVSPNPLALAPPFLQDTGGRPFVENNLIVQSQSGDDLTGTRLISSSNLIQVDVPSPESGTELNFSVRLHVQDAEEVSSSEFLTVQSPIAEIDGLEIPVRVINIDPVQFTPPAVRVSASRPGGFFSREVRIQYSLPDLRTTSIDPGISNVTASLSSSATPGEEILILQGAVPEPVGNQSVLSTDVAIQVDGNLQLERHLPLYFMITE